MSLRKIPRFYHITHDLQIVWVIWDMYVDTLHVGQIIRNLDYLNKAGPLMSQSFMVGILNVCAKATPTRSPH